MSVQIENISDRDRLLLTIEQVKEGIKPSRCPSCMSTEIQEKSCIDGSICGHNCGGGGWSIFCANCNLVINEAECEEYEES